MFKTLKVFITIVILLQLLINHAICNDDEFAEFDEFNLGDVEQVIEVKNQADKQSKWSQEQSSRHDDKPSKQDQSQAGDTRNDEKGSQFDSVSNSKDYSPDSGGDGSKSKKPDLKLVNVPSIKQFKLENYTIEIAFLLATFFYLANFFIGSAKNVEFAQSWFEHSKDLFKQQFVLVGGAPTLDSSAQKRDEETEATLAAMKKQRGLIKSSESLFTIWNSGRVGMEGLLVEINLLKRQDLFSMALNLLKVQRDNLILRFSLGQEGYENFVFCIAHRTQATKLVRDMVDINTFCPKRKPSGFDKLMVMSELSDVASFIFDQNTLNFLKKHERSVNYIHITDRYSTDKSEETSALQKLAVPKRIATFSFAFPRTDEERAEFILFPLALLDRLRRFKLTRDSKQKSEKNRQRITDFLQKTEFSLRQEAAQAKKEELRRLEKERIYNEDDPEKQRKWEKKEAKREQKKNKMKVKLLKH